VKPRILITREVFDETLAYLAQHCEVDANQEDRALDTETLARRLRDREGVMCALTEAQGRGEHRGRLQQHRSRCLHRARHHGDEYTRRAR
jgi:hypothetical protein